MNLILGIETSCDDTSAALLTDGGRVLSSVVASQLEVHAPYGGVVPELASRHHLENLPGTVAAALAKAGAEESDLSAVAATAGPGLLGSLLVGLSYAKTLAWGLGLPLFTVNHVEAHLRSPWIEHPDLPYPALSLAVSGGHSHLFFCTSPRQIRLVAGTRDDAAGEALDKLAKHLHLPYPGGPVLDRLAPRGNPKALSFSLPKMSTGSLDYSFSGLKTAALHYLRTRALIPSAVSDLDQLPSWEYDLVASFQKRVVDHLLQRMKRAALLLKPRSLTMAGGVACNSLLRNRLLSLGEELGLPAAFPSPSLCTDNAAMVAFRALDLLRSREAAPPEVDAFPTAHWQSVDRAPRPSC
jgi:N6-L-threonylcarbamoyladenine synthase